MLGCSSCSEALLGRISFCAPSALSHSFATHHDAQIWRCFSTLVGLGTDAVCHSAKITASLPLAVGVLGLRSATKLRFALHWASWADTIKMVSERHPQVAERIIQAIRDRDDAPSIQAILSSQANLEEAGFVSPVWSDLASGRAEAEPDHEEFLEPKQPRVGWQSKAAREVESRSFEGVMDLLHDPHKALLRSQAGPLASAPFVAMPVDRMCCIESQSFRILLLRRLRQPFLSQNILAGAPVFLTALATTGRLVLWLEFWGPGDFHWRTPQPVSAEKVPGHGHRCVQPSWHSKTGGCGRWPPPLQGRTNRSGHHTGLPPHTRWESQTSVCQRQRSGNHCSTETEGEEVFRTQR